jgi:hypothetical protein
MIGVIIAAYCCVVQWLVHASQNNVRRRDRHQQQCQGQVMAGGQSDKCNSLWPNNKDDSCDNSSSSLTTSVHDDNSSSSDEAVSSSDDGSGPDEPSSSDRPPPENVVVERKHHAAVNRKSGGGKPRKSLLGNILSYVTRKRKVDLHEEVKPPIPAWSQFAVADTSRPYVEDYGDDDFGEGLLGL